MLRSSPLLYVALSACVSLFCSLYLHVFAVCICSLFLFLPFFSLPSVLSSLFLFFYLCVPLSIYREIPKKLFFILLSTDQIMEQFLSVFSSTTPNFMFSCDPLFSLFLFSLFRYFLNSFLIRNSPLSPNHVPHFLVVIFLYLLFSFSIILLLHLLLPVAIFNSLSPFFFVLFYFYLFRDNGRLTFWHPTFPYFFFLFIYLIMSPFCRPSHVWTHHINESTSRDVAL